MIGKWTINKCLKFALSAIVLWFLADNLGIFLFVRTRNFDDEFAYPYDGDIRAYTTDLRQGKTPEVDPINHHDYRMVLQAKGKCVDVTSEGLERDIRLVYIIKSAVSNFHRRSAIRRTWGYERRFSDVKIRTVFLLGWPSGDEYESKATNDKVMSEYEAHKDIVQGDFTDAYFNNTIKTMMGYRWASNLCGRARFYAFVDDDYYVSTRNLIRFLRNPVGYPRYLDQDVVHFDQPQIGGRKLRQIVDFDLPDDVELYAGYVFESSYAKRSKLSPWFISLEDYPFDKYPPYVTGGMVLVSRETMHDFYYASHFVKRFRLDDIYVAIIAKKLGVEPFHSRDMHMYCKPYSRAGDYEYVVGSHGFDNPQMLERVWNEQKQAGSA